MSKKTKVSLLITHLPMGADKNKITVSCEPVHSQGEGLEGQAKTAWFRKRFPVAILISYRHPSPLF